MRTFIEFFRFNQDPFKRTPDIEFYFPTQMHADALDTLNYLIHSDEPFVVITGEPGTGKTITLRKFMSELPANIVCAYILFPNLTPEELFMAILEDFNIQVDKNLTKNALFAKLRDFLLEVSQEGKKCVIIIDEAQNLPVETLEELRILSNLETEKDKLLKIILAGQPELDAKLNQEGLRQLKQRVTLYTSLNNITEEDIKDYINYHIDRAVKNTAGVDTGKFNKNTIKIQSRVIKKIAKMTKGNPRLINTLMERTIIAAFLDESYTVTEHHLNSALSSVNNVIATVHKQNTFNNRLKYIAAIFAGLVIIGGGYISYDKFISSKEDNKALIVTDTVKSDIQKDVAVKEESTADNKTLASLDNSQSSKSIENETNVISSEVSTINNEQAVEDNLTTPTYEAVIPENIDADNYTEDTPVEVIVEEKEETLSPQIVEPVKEVTIAANSLNIRAEPSLESVRVGAARNGQKFEYVSELNEWVEIRVSPVRTGWVFKRYVSISERQ